MTIDPLIPLVARARNLYGAEPYGVCKKCQTQLNDNNVAYWEGMDICRDCAASGMALNPGGALEALLQKGYLAIVRMRQVWYLRIEVRTADKKIADNLERCLGGTVQPHASKTYRWAAASLRDLRKVGGVLMASSPNLGLLALKYCTTETQEKRSVLIQAAAIKLGKRSIRIRDYRKGGAT